MIKTFEAFETDNSKVYIIGIPSGEALQVKRDDLESLYKEGLIRYDTSYVETGFYAFDDIDVDLVMRYVEKPLKVVPAGKKANKDITIFAHEFDEILVDAILGMIDQYPTDIEIYIQEDCMGISYGDFYMEITMNSTINPKYKFIKRHKGKVIDKYGIVNDSMLVNRIDHELYN